MEFKDYYKTLGVEPDADKTEIKKAYRRLARKYHPDVSSEHGAEAQFKAVSEAYEVLGHDERRAEYDQLRQYRSDGGRFKPPPGWTGSASAGDFEFDGSDFSEFFSSIFGGRGDAGRRSSRGFTSSEDFASLRGQDVEIDLPVFLEETLEEHSRTIEYRLPRYDESGRRDDVRKTLKVKVPQGVFDGQRIRLKGQGGPGYGNGPSGDLYLRIKLVPHPLFDVVGRDLNITLPVTPWEAALGATVTVPTLSGKIKLNIKPGSQSGERLRIKGKGLVSKQGQGNLYVILKVVMPDEIDEKSRKLWAELKDHADFDPRKNMEGSA